MKHQKAFTLIELMVVISIITMLASIVLVAILGAKSKAADARRVLEAKEVGTALEIYRSNLNSYPVISTNQGPYYNFARNWGADPGHPIPYNELSTLLQPYISKLPQVGSTYSNTLDKIEYINGSPVGVCAGDGGGSPAMLIKNGFGLFVTTDDISYGTKDPEGVSQYVYEIYGGEHIRFPSLFDCLNDAGGPYGQMSPGAGN